MTLESVALIFAGVLVNGFTFACGVAAGVSLVERKQDNDDSDSDTEADDESRQWHLPLDIGAPHRPGLRSGSGANKKPQANPPKRADR